MLRQYAAALAKLEEKRADRGDLIAAEAPTSRLTSKVSLVKRGDAFALGDRGRVVDGFAERGAPTVAGSPRIPVEEVLRSLLRVVVDMGACERFVAGALFGADASAAVRDVMERGLRATADAVAARAAAADAVGLLLGARLVRCARAEAGATPGLAEALCPFFDSCDGAIWPRLAAQMDANVESVRAFEGTVASTAPHVASKRFAELAASIYALFGGGAEAGDVAAYAMHSAELLAGAALLSEETVELLGRAAAGFRSPRDATVFLINNYDAVARALTERSLERTAPRARFARELDKARAAFVGDVLAPTAVGRVIAFVAKTDRSLARLAENAALDLDADAVERLGSDLAARWKAVVDDVNALVLRSVANFLNGAAVLKLVVTKLLAANARFLEIVRTAWRRPPPFLKNLTSQADILAGVRDVCRDFS